MNPQKATAKDFFLNLGSIVALYTVAISLVNLLFTVINNAYPQTTQYYGYASGSSISWSVATLIIFFPVFVGLMWLLEKEYIASPEKRNLGIKKWLTYITLFVAGAAMAIDLVTILYYFLDGRDLTMAFVLKVFVVLVVTLLVFMYYISELREKLNSRTRKIWAGVAFLVILSSIIWGFSVLGSPQTQRLLKYDNQKINDLMSIQSEVQNYYAMRGLLPQNLNELAGSSYYIPRTDAQSDQPYEYERTGATTFNLCAVFNKATTESDNLSRVYGMSWTHPAGRHCFNLNINPNIYQKPAAVR